MRNKNSGSQAEMQSAMYKAARNYKHAIFTEIEVAFPARVVSYDSKHHTADLQPLAKLSDGQTSAQFLDVPVAENCYILDEIFDNFKGELAKADNANSYRTSTDLVGKIPKNHFMREGVTVICVVLDRDFDNWDGTSKTFELNSSRTHDANDAVVIGVLGGDGVNG